jgi:hypothetical protein
MSRISIGVITLIVQNYFTKKQTKVTADAAQEVAKELKPNGGASLRDVADRMEANQEAAKLYMAAMEARLDHLEHPLPTPPPGG